MLRVCRFRSIVLIAWFTIGWTVQWPSAIQSVRKVSSEYKESTSNSNEQRVDQLIDRVLQHVSNDQLKRQVQHLRVTRDQAALDELATRLQSKSNLTVTQPHEFQQLDRLLQQSLSPEPPDSGADDTWTRLLNKWNRWKRNGRLRPNATSAQIKMTQRFELGNLPLAEGFAAVLLGKLIGIKAGFLAGKLATAKSTCPTPVEEEIIVTEEDVVEVTEAPARDELLPEDDMPIGYAPGSLAGQGGSARRRVGSRKRRRKVIRVHHNGNVRTIHIYRRRRRPINQIEPIANDESMMHDGSPSLTVNHHHFPHLHSSSAGPDAFVDQVSNANADAISRRSIQRILTGQYEYSP